MQRPSYASHLNLQGNIQYTVSCLTLKIYLHQLLKKKLASGVEKSDLNKIYLLPFRATRELKLTMFQYKIIPQITNEELVTQKVATPSCPFCLSECQTLCHLFINCTHAISFWSRFQKWYSICSNRKLLLSTLEVKRLCSE